jgi:hypothetical protein
MNTTPTEKESGAIQIGRDRVTLGDNEVTIQAAREMPDWQVREFKATPIYFRDQKYILVGKNRAERPFAWRYVLRPWPEGTSTSPNFFTYDAAAVAERDADFRSGVGREVFGKALLPLYPVLGFLWSGTQRRLEPLGYASRTITSVSIFTTFALLFLHGVSVIVLINTSLRSGSLALGGTIRMFYGQDTLALGPLHVGVMWLDAILMVALIADVLMRYTYYLRDENWSGGFLEWLVRRPGGSATF